MGEKEMIIAALAAWYMANFTPYDYPLLTGIVLGAVWEYEMRQPLVRMWKKAKEQN